MRRFVLLLLAALPSLAQASTLDETVAPVLVTGTVFGFSAIIVAVVAYARHRAQQLRHETIRLALEKGQSLPPRLLEETTVLSEKAIRRSPERDLRHGLVLLALGVGLSLYLGLTQGFGQGTHWAVGFIPGFIGVAYLISFAVSSRKGTSPKSPG